MLFGGEQLWECFSCGHSFTGGKRQDFCLSALAACPWTRSLCFSLLPGRLVQVCDCSSAAGNDLSKLKGRQSALEEN